MDQLIMIRMIQYQINHSYCLISTKTDKALIKGKQKIVQEYLDKRQIEFNCSQLIITRHNSNNPNKSINVEEVRRDHLNSKLDQTDANNSTECFDMIRNFNKMAAGRLGQDQASEFKKYLEKSKERAQDRVKTSQYASNYLGSMTDRQSLRQPFESLPIPYEKSQKKELVKTFTERYSILQQKITDEEIRLRFAQKASLLKNNNHHKIANLYDRSLFYKDMKEHINQEAKRLSDMGYMRKFEEENPPNKDDEFRWLKKKLSHNKKAKDQLKSFQQNLKKAKSHEKLPSINRDQEQFDDYLENFMEIVQNNIKKGPGKPLPLPQ
ncbi:UNKNOWN [Stylonychia lemnae]|uniref:Uncharacterized protein n=1 Tax=Stylonychia lemnae TaxID=5949 RepID=A0A078A0D2_STYLE|nr:UNKNOWN [Stylonychia lemnae]|eukprot:CDW75661.1 UNKNOWN [Stylonychia lemnae]